MAKRKRKTIIPNLPTPRVDETSNNVLFNTDHDGEQHITTASRHIFIPLYLPLSSSCCLAERASLSICVFLHYLPIALNFLFTVFVCFGFISDQRSHQEAALIGQPRFFSISIRNLFYTPWRRVLLLCSIILVAFWSCQSGLPGTVKYRWDLLSINQAIPGVSGLGRRMF